MAPVVADAVDGVAQAASQPVQTVAEPMADPGDDGVVVVSKSGDACLGADQRGGEGDRAEGLVLHPHEPSAQVSGVEGALS
jgi:hypothetical protein